MYYHARNMRRKGLVAMLVFALVLSNLFIVPVGAWAEGEEQVGESAAAAQSTEANAGGPANASADSGSNSVTTAPTGNASDTQAAPTGTAPAETTTPSDSTAAPSDAKSDAGATSEPICGGGRKPCRVRRYGG